MGAGYTTPLFYTLFDGLGRLSQLYRWLTPGDYGIETTWGYDPVGRLASLSLKPLGAVSTSTFGYNPASQITSLSRSSDAYAWNGYATASKSYAVNGLNQYTTVAGAAQGYDANGNLTSDGATSYVYDAENRLVSASNGTALAYDPLGRLDSVTKAGATTRFLYDGDRLVAEYDGSGTVQRRYVHGDGVDDPQVWYEGSSTTDRRYLVADQQGSVVAVTDTDGNALNIDAYDEYGQPKSTNLGRFQYTGQTWLSELGVYYYKARMYAPKLGRFLQTDPVGYVDQVNLYAYVGNDPINGADATGLYGCGSLTDQDSATCRSYFVGEQTNPNFVPGSGGRGNLTSTANAARGESGNGNTGQGDGRTSAAGNSGGAQTQRDGEVVVTGRSQVMPPPGDNIIERLFNGALFYLTSGTSACCFTAGTLVSTPSGLKAIETLKVGDLVTSRSDKTGETAAKPIVSITPAHKRRIWTVAVSYKNEGGRWTDERYETTEDHPWRTVNNQWLPSASLKHGQALARENGRAIVAAVVGTKAIKITYNLEIADFHTYFVGKSRIWVHNACPSDLRPATKRELMNAAKRDGFNSIERWKADHLAFPLVIILA